MKLFEETKRTILFLGNYCKATNTIGHAAASACSQLYGVSALRISAGLDYQNKQLVQRLMNITDEPDFSNDAQYEMLNWLEDNGYLVHAPKANEL